jgi:hypothetical protein
MGLITQPHRTRTLLDKKIFATSYNPPSMAKKAKAMPATVEKKD